MGRPASPLLGKRIGCYTVVERVRLDVSQPSHQRSHWRVVCDCGFTKVVSGQNLVRHFPLRCAHVPAGHRIIGPAEVAVLDACRQADVIPRCPGISDACIDRGEWRIAQAIVDWRKG